MPRRCSAAASMPSTSKEFLTTIHRNAQRIAEHGLRPARARSARRARRRSSASACRSRSRRSSTMRRARRRASRRRRRSTSTSPPELAVLGTREGLDHVVQNLIDNAVKYGGGTPVTVRAERTNGHVRISDRRCGPGIPKGHEDRIFERFYRIDAGRSRDAGRLGPRPRDRQESGRGDGRPRVGRARRAGRAVRRRARRRHSVVP